MKARDLITGRLTEATTPEGSPMGSEAPPPGSSGGPRRPGGGPRPRRMPPGMMPPGMEGDEMEMMMGGRGGMGGPKRMLNPRDEGMLKDVMILIMATVAGSRIDEEIARALMAGQDLNPGQIQHILDEVGRVRDLPESHHQVLEKLFKASQAPPSPPESSGPPA